MLKKSLFLLSALLLVTSCENHPTNIEKYNLSIVCDSNEGYVTGSINGAYEYGSEISITANANEGYEFSGFLDNDVPVISHSNTYTFNIIQDTEIKVEFTKLETTNFYDFDIVFDESMGNVEGTASGSYEENTEISLNALPFENYIFVGFYADDEMLTENDSYNFTLTGDTSIEARFSANTENPDKPDDNPDNPDIPDNPDDPNDKPVNDYNYLYDNTILPNRGNQNVDIDEYYEPCKGLKGEELKDALHEIISGHESFGYNSSKNSWNKSDVLNGQEYVFYEGTNSETRLSNCNREHVWAKSHGNFGESQPTGSDYHNLHPTTSKLNSTRGNMDFGEVDKTQSYKDAGFDYDYSTPSMKGNYIGKSKTTKETVFEPKDEFKGDTARTIFYMAVRYDGDSGEIDLEVDGAIDTSRYYDFTAGAKGLHGNFNDLYKWATTDVDPVSDFEVHRNNVIDEDYQHNRNPFIDHPEFVIMIYDKNYDGPGALLDGNLK